MKLPFPKPWSGSSPIAAWMNRLLECCKQEVFLESKDFRRVDGKGGFYIEQKNPGASGGKGSTLNANYKLMIITQLGSSLVPPKPDLLICRTYDPNSHVTGLTDIYVAKDTEARQVAKEYYYDNGDNITVNYTYFTATSQDSSYGDNFRLANDGTNSELQVMEMRYYTQAMLASIIPAIPLNQATLWVVDTGISTGVTDPTGAAVTRLEVKPVRVWIRVATQ